MMDLGPHSDGSVYFVTILISSVQEVWDIPELSVLRSLKGSAHLLMVH